MLKQIQSYWKFYVSKLVDIFTKDKRNDKKFNLQDTGPR